MSRSPCEARDPRVALATLGCKLNQWDTQGMRRRLAECCDIVDFGCDADYYVINTCTVTSGSDAQARQLIRRTARLHPEAKLLVTGCYAERAGDELLSIEGVTQVLGNAAKERLPDLIRLHVAPRADAAPHRAGEQGPREGPKLGRSRAHVAIQRGCNRGCTYCIVPSVRGAARSFAPGRIAAEVEDLLEEGYREIILTGTYLGDYGADLPGRENLALLLGELNEVVDGRARLRISSLGPSDITEELIETVGECRNVCRHFHVAFQSGDDGVLAAMGRDYDSAALHRALELIGESFPDCGVGGDVMAGFPGEDEAAFGNTIEVVKAYPFSYLHVFVFSPRPGTDAERMPGRVRPVPAAERSLQLRELSAAKGMEFAARFVGRRIEVVAEGPSERDGELAGTSREYLRASFEGDPELKGRLVTVDVGGVLSARRVSGRAPTHQTSR